MMMLHETKAIKTMVSSFCPQTGWDQGPENVSGGGSGRGVGGGFWATYQNILLILFIQEKFHAFVWSSHRGNLHAATMAGGLNPLSMRLHILIIIIVIILVLISIDVQPLDQIMLVRQLQHRIAGDVHQGARLARYNSFVCVQIGLDEPHGGHLHGHRSDHGQRASGRGVGGSGAVGAQLIEHLRLLGNTRARW